MSHSGSPGKKTATGKRSPDKTKPTASTPKKKQLRDLKLTALYDAAKTGSDNDLNDSFFKELKALEIHNDIPLIDTPDQTEEYTPLIWAAKSNKVSTCQLLVEKGNATIDKIGGWNGNTALMKAAEKGHERVVEALLKLGANPNIKNTFGNSAIMLAAEFGNDKVIDVLIKEANKKKVKAKLDETNKLQYTALILAAEGGHKLCVEKLCNTVGTNRIGVEIDAKNIFGKTALIMAAELDHKDVVEFLCTSYKGLKFKLDVDAVSGKGKSALMLASLKGHVEVVQCLIVNKANIHLECKNESGKENDPKDNALTLACSEHVETGTQGVDGKLCIVRKLIEKGEKGARCPENCTALDILMKACETSSAIVEEMLSWCVKRYFPDTAPEINNAAKNLVLLTTPRTSDNRTCLMCAGAKGNIKVMIYLIKKLQEECDKYHLHPQSHDYEHLSALMNRCPTRYTFVKACYKVEDHTGDTAVSLLAEYYQEYPDKFKEFINEAAGCYQLFHLMSHIVPKLPNPSNTILPMLYNELFPQLQNQQIHADVKLLSVLVNIAVTLKKSAHSKPREKHKLEEMLVKVENAIETCMSCTSMDKWENVAKILQQEDNDLEYCGYAAFVVDGPLTSCIKYDLPELLSTTPISNLIDRVFFASLRPAKRKIIHGMWDIFQFRSEWLSLRYCPKFMFIIEGLAKALYFILVSIAIVHDHGPAFCPLYFTWAEFSVLVMCVANFMFIGGEMMDRGSMQEHFKDTWNILDILGHLMQEHFRDKWNILDILGHSLVLCWCLSYFLLFDYADYGKVSLALSAIPMSLGLLRFISIEKEIGIIVNLIFAMADDLKYFPVVFVVSTMGFAFAFHSIFRRSEDGNVSEFADIWSPAFALFFSALGDHDLLKEGVKNHPYAVVGLSIMIIYITFSGIVVFNLVIAKMNNTFDKVSENARQQWTLMMAKNVKKYLLIFERRNAFCMLPPPLNILVCCLSFFSPFFYFFEWLASQKSKEDRPSICGSTSDIVLGFISSPFFAFYDSYLMYREWLGRHKYLYYSVIIITFSPLFYSFYRPLYYSAIRELVLNYFFKRNLVCPNVDQRSYYPAVRAEDIWRNQILFYYGITIYFCLISLILVPTFFIILRYILWEVFTYKCVRISNRDNRIIYDEEKKDSKEIEKFTSGVLEMKIIRIKLQHNMGYFGRTSSVYGQVRAKYGKKDYDSHTKIFKEASPEIFNDTFQIELIDGGKLKLQIFDRYRGESVGDGVLFAESDENDLKTWIADGRFEGKIPLYRPGYDNGTKKVVAVGEEDADKECYKNLLKKTPWIQVAVKIKYPNPPMNANSHVASPNDALFTEADRKRIFKCLLREEQ